MKRSPRLALHAQDLVVALKLVSLESAPWTYASLAAALGLSPSQVHTSVQRLERCALYSASARRVVRRNLLELLIHGVRYVFPAQLGAPARGRFTGASAVPLAPRLPSGGDHFVWASAHGEDVGLSVDPLIPEVPAIAASDPRLGELLTLVDALRLGRARERGIAEAELTTRLTGPRVPEAQEAAP